MGILVGYLGIGGGVAFVPILFFIFAPRYSPDIVPKLAVGTSLGAVVFSTIAGTIRHWQLGHVVFKAFLMIAIGAVLGSFCGGLIVSLIPGAFLKRVIGAILITAAIWMVLYRPNYTGAEEGHPKWWLIPAGFAMGVIASTVGIGGGMFAVPILSIYIKLDPKHSAGTSSAIAFVLSVCAVVGHVFWGSKAGMPEEAFGYVMVKEAVFLGIPAAIGAILGAGLHRKVKPAFFKYAFSLLLIIVGFRILIF